ncbi:single-stranded DNA-binding protein [Pedobacter jeongneungensis]|uniref:single-stranded DNA-binding protein n=1 Tax=Pedobacter jeongneungensis TaxID=947309 RepID=UPI000469CBD4|nr:single-stranded DNA-binding protein [Pedobacter jeongneungensis]
MRRTKNTVTLIGFVGKDPIFNSVGTEKIPFAAFSLITNDVVKRADPAQPGKYIMETRPNYHKIVAWRRNAEIIRDYVKGKAYINIEGRLFTNEYKDGNGATQKSVEIVVNEILLLDKGRDTATLTEMSTSQLEELNDVPGTDENLNEEVY